MRKLDFRVSYNTTLFNFVDFLSKWDIFVGEHIYDYFLANYGLDTMDLLELEKYVLIRREFGWAAESDLFDWAYSGFRKESKFFPLLEFIRYFEERENVQGDSLKSELEEATTHLESLTQSLEEKFDSINAEVYLSPFLELFQSKKIENNIFCYLTYTPDPNSSQAGANGNSIYSQINTKFITEQSTQRLLTRITHEFAHKFLNPGKYFQNHPDLDKRKVYGEKYKTFYPDKYYGFIEEVIIYSIVNVLMFKEDADVEVRRYQEDGKKFNSGLQHPLMLWTSIKDVKPILEAYQNGKSDRQTTMTALDDYFIGLVIQPE